MKEHDTFMNGHHKAITLIEISPDGSYFVSTALDKRVKIWDTTKLKLMEDVKMPHDHLISSIAISPSGTSIAVGSINGDITIINAETGKCLNL